MVSEPAARPDLAWWRNAVVYQVYVRSFADADGDGLGDLQGIIDHLAYLRGLSVDAIWLCPCFPSPQKDHGYDVADYFDIEPSYGDLAAFDRLVQAAREHDIKVMLDVVPNHCSSQHAWFQAALAAPKESSERARFYFRDGRGEHGELPPNNWTAVFGGSAWSRTTEPDGTAGQWYLHLFTPWQPDFDWDNEDVQEHFDRVLRFWFDRGVEGFRVDAISVVGKADGLPDAPTLPGGVRETDEASRNPHVQYKRKAHDYWRRWRRVIDMYEADHPGRRLVTVSEAYTPHRPDVLARFVSGDQFHQSFCFDLMLTPWNSAMIRESVASVHQVLTDAGAALTWTLNNHDTQRAVTRYGRAASTSPDSWTGNNLVYPDSPVDEALGRRRAEALFAFTAALPGAFYVYQGEELGLPEVLDIPDHRREDPIFARTGGREIGRDGCRVPLPWTTDAATSFGFSNVSTRDGPWLPQPAGWGAYAASTQAEEPSSTLRLYRRVMQQRRALDESAPLEWVAADDPELVVFRRGDVLVVLNLGDRAIGLPRSLAGGLRMIISTAGGPGVVGVVPSDSCIWLGGA